MKIITIEILSTDAIQLLQDLENQNLIRLHNRISSNHKVDWKNKYKGAMSQQTLSEIDQQLNELRNAWE